MKGLQIFNNPNFGEIRTLEENGVVLFCGSDVAKALGYSRPADAVTAHCKGSVIRRLPTTGGHQDAKLIPESDLYRLIFRSKLPTAEEFTDWVTGEVLPAIRKTGGYSSGSAQPTTTMSDTATHIEAAKIMATCLDSNRFYVLNILKHVVPDISQVPITHAAALPAADPVEETDEDEQSVRNSSSTSGYTVPFRCDKLKSLLSKHNLTLRMLERAIDSPKGTARRWASGTNRPSRQYRDRLCEFFGVHENYFDGYEQQRFI